MLILNLGFGTSKNKKIDHRGKENCAYESDHISLLRDAKCTKFLFLCFTATQKKMIILQEK